MIPITTATAVKCKSVVLEGGEGEEPTSKRCGSREIITQLTAQEVSRAMTSPLSNAKGEPPPADLPTRSGQLPNPAASEHPRNRGSEQRAPQISFQTALQTPEAPFHHRIALAFSVPSDPINSTLSPILSPRRARDPKPRNPFGCLLASGSYGPPRPSVGPPPSESGALGVFGGGGL